MGTHFNGVEGDNEAHHITMDRRKYVADRCYKGEGDRGALT